jgi:hypothetical protein
MSTTTTSSAPSRPIVKHRDVKRASTSTSTSTPTSRISQSHPIVRGRPLPRLQAENNARNSATAAPAPALPAAPAAVSVAAPTVRSASASASSAVVVEGADNSQPHRQRQRQPLPQPQPQAQPQPQPQALPNALPVEKAAPAVPSLWLHVLTVGTRQARAEMHVARACAQALQPRPVSHPHPTTASTSYKQSGTRVHAQSSLGTRPCARTEIACERDRLVEALVRDRAGRERAGTSDTDRAGMLKTMRDRIRATM